MSYIVYCIQAAIGTSTLVAQNSRQFTDDISKFIFVNGDVWIAIKISPRFFPNGPIDYKSTLVQLIAWRRSGDKPLSEPIMAWFIGAYMRYSASKS